MKRSELQINKIWVGEWPPSGKAIFYNKGYENLESPKMTEGIALVFGNKYKKTDSEFCTGTNIKFSEPTEEELELFYSFLPEYRYIKENNDLFNIY